MTALTPDEREAILQNNPSAAPGELEADIAEYEQLVSAMFSKDPSAIVPSAEPQDAAGSSRLSELHAKLFG